MRKTRGGWKTSKTHFLPTKGRCGARAACRAGEVGFSSLWLPLPQSHLRKPNKPSQTVLVWPTQPQNNSFPRLTPMLLLPPPSQKFWVSGLLTRGQEGGLAGRALGSCGTSLTPCYKESSLWPWCFFSQGSGLFISSYSHICCPEAARWSDMFY